MVPAASDDPEEQAKKHVAHITDDVVEVVESAELPRAQEVVIAQVLIARDVHVLDDKNSYISKLKDNTFPPNLYPCTALIH